MSELIMLELGGGLKGKGPPWVNLDKIETADIRFDLDSLPRKKLPFADCSVRHCFSSHCLEHVRNPWSVLHEIARVCAVGAEVEIRVPHPLSDLAMTCGHRQVISPVDVQNVTHHFVSEWWPKDRHERRLKLVREEYGESCYFDEISELYPSWDRESVLKFAPRAAHDCRFFFTVVANGQ